MGFWDKLLGKHPPPSSPTRKEPPAAPADATPDLPEDLSSQEAAARLSAQPAPALLDVREAEELDYDGFIPASVHIAMSEIETRLAELDPARPTIVYCAAGVRSYNVGCYLLAQGFQKVANLRGGIHSWRGDIARR